MISSTLRLSFVNKGTTVAHFMLDGNVAVARDRLKSAVRYGERICTYCFRNHVGSGSSSECLQGAEPIISMMCAC